MSYLLFVIYTVVLSWAVTKIPLCKNSGLNSKMLIGIFLLKIAAGVLLGFITSKAVVADTWIYHRDALDEYHLLLSNPGRYFTNIFDSGYQDKFGGVLQLNHSYWNDLKTNLTVKLVSLLHVFSGGHYYVNVVLYNFLTLLGCMGLYRVYNFEYKNNCYLLAAVIFLLPSLLFFGSSIHKDGLIAAALGLLLFTFYKSLYAGGFTLKRVLLMLAAFFLIFLIRNYVAVLLLPGLFALSLCSKTVYNKYLVFAATYFVFFVLFFNIGRVFPALNPPQLVAQKQADFFGLARANSYIETTVLVPTAAGFASSLPQALSHSLLRPVVKDYNLSHPLLPFAAELLLYGCIILISIAFQKKSASLKPFIIFGFLFSVSVLIVIGYTVPVIWAIVRYRSIYLPFLLLPFLLTTDWLKLVAIVRIKK